MTARGHGNATAARRTVAALVVLGALAAGCRSDGQTSTTTSSAATAAGPSAAVRSGFVAFGDFGGGPAQRTVAVAMSRWAAGHRVDALVTTGDNVYEQGEPQRFGAQLDQPYQRLRRTRPLWATLGNHDVAAGHGADEPAAVVAVGPVPGAWVATRSWPSERQPATRAVSTHSVARAWRAAVALVRRRAVTGADPDGCGGAGGRRGWPGS